MLMSNEKKDTGVSSLNDETALKTLPVLSEYAKIMDPLAYDVEGRDGDIERIQSTFRRGIISNIFLLGDAGVGKTTLIRHMASFPDNRIYVEVDLTKMSSSDNGDGVLVMASRLKQLFDEVKHYAETRRKDIEDEKDAPEIVLFIDEIHLLFQTSANAVEAIKPYLASSVEYGIRLIVATTFDEYHQYKIDDNQAFIQRFVTVRLGEPDDDTTFAILKSTAEREFNTEKLPFDDSILRTIVEVTNRYDPSSSQPRKSLMMFDAMLGAHRYTGQPIGVDLLAKEVYNTKGINIAINVDAVSLRSELDEAVYDQTLATISLESYLQIVIADLHDKTRPMGSFLFTGPTGVGKTELAKSMARLMFGSERYLVRFNMSEYTTADRVNVFRDELARRISDTPFAIVLIDEIEKAHTDCALTLLQVLDDAQLSDSNGRLVTFANTYIIATTNKASAIYEKTQAYRSDMDKFDALNKYLKLVKKRLEEEHFPTELLNRFNKIIIFGGLLRKTKEKIARRKLDRLKDEVLEKYNIVLQYGEEIIPWLVLQKDGDETTAGGARGIVRVIDDELKAEVARSLNKHGLRREMFIAVDPDPENGRVSEKRDLQFVDASSRIDKSVIYIDRPEVAKALSSRNMRAIEKYKTRVSRNLV